MTFRLDHIVPANKFFKGVFVGFFISLILWAVIIAVAVLTVPDDAAPLPDSIHIDAPAPHDQ